MEKNRGQGGAHICREKSPDYDVTMQRCWGGALFSGNLVKGYGVIGKERSLRTKEGQQTVVSRVRGRFFGHSGR